MPTYYGLRVDGGEFATERLTHPLDDLDVAKGLARELSLGHGHRDAVVAVVSRSGETNAAYFQDTAAAFVNGEELERGDELFPT